MERICIRIIGSGGQGAITMAKLLGEAAIAEKKDAVMTESYSPYITGGWSMADIVISGKDVDYPFFSKPDFLITMSQEGLEIGLKNPGSVIIAEKSLSGLPKGAIAVPATEISHSLGKRLLVNMVMLGALVSVSGVLNPNAVKEAISKKFPKAVDSNMKAFERGMVKNV